MKIALTSVSVDDPIAAFEFYTTILGFREKTFLPEMQLAIVVSPEDGNGTALLLEPDGNLGTKEYKKGLHDAGLPAIVFGTDDIARDYDQLRAKGVAFRGEPKRTEWGAHAIFDDTCGNLIQLHQD